MNYHTLIGITLCNLVTDNYRLSPYILDLYVGESGSFTCVSPKEVRWLFNKDVNLPDNVHTGSKQIKGYDNYVNPGEEEIAYYLTIMNARIENSGSYTCIGADDNVIFDATREAVVTGLKNYDFKLLHRYFYLKYIIHG